MTLNEQIDALILSFISNGRAMTLATLEAAVLVEKPHLMTALSRPAGAFSITPDSRVIDKSLKRLRRAKRIEWDKATRRWKAL